MPPADEGKEGTRGMENPKHLQSCNSTYDDMEEGELVE